MLAIKNLQQQGVKWPRCVIVLETEEESGSAHLLQLLEEAKEFVGKPDTVLCLDSTALDQSSLWLTSSYRGHCGLSVTVSGATEGYHSGDVGGVIPETFRVLRTLLRRIDDPLTGIVVPEFQSDIPEAKKQEAEKVIQSFKSALKVKLEEGVIMKGQDDYL